MALGVQSSWALYAGGVALLLQLRRGSSRVKTDKEGLYLLTWEFLSKEQYIRNMFTGDDKSRWRDLWPRLRAEQFELRRKAEAELTAQGITIHEAYIDPFRG